MDGRVRVGLVGAGPWARSVHAPGLAAHPRTELAAVWTRRPEAAAELAREHGADACGSFDELLARVDALAFAVPPDAQAELAARAATAGKHLILEKPIAAELDAATRLADTVGGAGVASLMMLTLRYASDTREWLTEVTAQGGWSGGSARWLSGALIGDTYRDSAWRIEHGALADVGPHVIDLLDAALGEITGVLAANRTGEDLWHLMFEHKGRATSTAALSLHLPVEPTVADLTVYGPSGYRTLTRTPGTAGECYTAMLDDFVSMIVGGARHHPCDVQRGLHLQRILDAAKHLATG